MCAKGLLFIYKAQVHSRCSINDCTVATLALHTPLSKKRPKWYVLNESQGEAGCPFQESTRSTPCRIIQPGWSGFMGLGFHTAGGTGWPSQGRRRSWRALQPTALTALLSPLCLPFKAMKCHPGGRQDPNKAPAWLFGHGLWVEAGNERRRQSKPDGSLWPAPSREAAWLCCMHMGFFAQATSLRVPGTCNLLRYGGWGWVRASCRIQEWGFSVQDSGTDGVPEESGFQREVPSALQSSAQL